MADEARLLFSCDSRWPVGQSLRDPQWSFQRGVSAIAKMVKNTPVIEAERPSARGLPPVRIRISFDWLGSDPSDAPLIPEEALLVGRSVSARYRVQASISAEAREGVKANEERCILVLEVPLVIGGLHPETCPPPPESGYIIVRGTEYCLRYHERFAFGTWIVTLVKKGGAVASMRMPPRELGGLSRAFRVTLASGGSVTTMKRRVSLGAVLTLLGDTRDTFAARTKHSSCIAWPSSAEEAHGIVTADIGRVIDHDAPELADAETFLARVVLPHLSASDKLEAIAHACDLVMTAHETGAFHDLDDLQHKRMDAPGERDAVRDAGFAGSSPLWHDPRR